MDIKWENPPEVALARIRTPGRYVEWAYALREYPGRWAKLPEVGGPRTEKGAANLAQSIRRGTTAGFSPKQSFEAVASSGLVWVRYVGVQEDGGEASEVEAPQATEPDPATTQEDRADPATVRHWARDNGYDVPERGRLPENLYEAYAQAQQAG